MCLLARLRALRESICVAVADQFLYAGGSLHYGVVQTMVHRVGNIRDEIRVKRSEHSTGK